MIPVFPAPGRVELHAGGELSFGLRLLGPLRQGEMDVLLAMLDGMSDFPFGNEEGRIVFQHVTFQGRRETPIADDTTPVTAERVEIVFETPAWLEQDGKPMEDLKFRSFFRSINRRLSVLTALYGHEEDADSAAFHRLDEFAECIVVREKDIQVMPWQRQSVARQREHRLWGLWGRVVFEGQGLGAFLPTLRMAEKTHIGKATSFGLGRIRITRVG